jgi:hypothetical protein
MERDVLRSELQGGAAELAAAHAERDALKRNHTSKLFSTNKTWQ